jgi:hypothetical protein
LTLQGWLRDKKGGNFFLKGREFFTWRPEEPAAYICVGTPSPENDIFTNLFKKAFTNCFRDVGGKVIDEESGLKSFSDSGLNRTSNIFATIVASTIPVLTIFVLNALKTTPLRIGLTVVFTAVFGAILAIFSTARRVEIFAATAT